MAQKLRNNSVKAVSVKNLHKSFGNVKVLLGVSFDVGRGEILAMLGPNGAGKTTTIKILSTLLYADSGKATINGFDVRTQDEKVRASIGLTGQYAAVDEYLTGEENLHMMGRLYRLSMSDTLRRTNLLLDLFDLQKDAKRPVKNYSGGMRRKLDLAMSMVASPPILFLDEPTTGLDPPSRLAMWETIELLAKNGITILLTTQYMEEADRLADNIVVIDGGKVIAKGTPNELKSELGSDRLELTISQKSSFTKAIESVKSASLQIDPDQRTISIATKGGIKEVRTALQKLEDAKIQVENLSLHRPTLDDVFLTLTGHAAAEDSDKTKQKGSTK